MSYWDRYRSRPEKLHDQQWENHLDYMCPEDCEFCPEQAESVTDDKAADSIEPSSTASLIRKV